MLKKLLLTALVASGALLLVITASRVGFFASDGQVLAQRAKQGGKSQKRTKLAVVETQPILAVTRKWLPNSLFGLIFPSQLTITNQTGTPPQTTPLVISEALYAGNTSDATHARLVAVAYPGTAQTAPLRHFLEEGDRDLSLQRIADRIMNNLRQEPAGPQWLTVLTVDATWTPWQLRLTVSDAAGAVRPGASMPTYVLPALRNTAQPVSVADVKTDGIILPLSPEAQIELSAAVSFARESITFGFVPSAQAPSLPLPGRDGYTLDMTGVPAEASAAIALPPSFIDYIFARRSIQVGVTQDNKPVTMRDTASSVSAAGLTVSGSVGPQAFRDPTAAPTYDPADVGQQMTVELVGEQLRFNRLTAGPTDCRLPLSKRLICAEVRAKALGAGPYATQVYKDKPAKPEGVYKIGTLRFNGKQTEVRGLVLKIQPRPSFLMFSGHISAEEK